MFYRFAAGYVRLAGAVNRAVGKVLGWLAGLLVLLFCFDVVARYVFNFSSPAIFELEWHLFATIFLLGAGYTLLNDRHVRVDVFYANFPKRKKAWVDLLGTVFFLLPFCAVVMVAAVPYIRNSFLMDEGSSDPGGLPARYLIKGAIFAGFALLLVQGAAVALRSVLVLRRKEALLGGQAVETPTPNP